MELLSSSFCSRQPASLDNIHFYHGPPSLNSTRQQARDASPELDEWPDIDHVVPWPPRSDVLSAPDGADTAQDFADRTIHPETAVESGTVPRVITASDAAVQDSRQLDITQCLLNLIDGQTRVYDVLGTLPAPASGDDPLPIREHESCCRSPANDDCDTAADSIEPTDLPEVPFRDCKGAYACLV